jgi:hypothetical protein
VGANAARGDDEALRKRVGAVQQLTSAATRKYLQMKINIVMLYQARRCGR